MLLIVFVAVAGWAWAFRERRWRRTVEQRLEVERRVAGNWRNAQVEPVLLRGPWDYDSSRRA